MINKVSSNSSKMAPALELGLLSSAFIRKNILGKQSLKVDWLSPYVEGLSSNREIEQNRFIQRACREVLSYLKSVKAIRKIVLAGYEAIWVDELVKKLAGRYPIGILPNSYQVDQERLKLNYQRSTRVQVLEVAEAWKSLTPDTLVIVPFFRSVENLSFCYSLPRNLLGSEIRSYCFRCIGFELLAGLPVLEGYDYEGALLPLAKVNPAIFDEILSFMGNQSTVFRTK